MSFSSDVKKEITQQPADGSAAKCALCALLLIRADLILNRDGMNLSFETQNAATVKYIFQILKNLYDPMMQLSVIKKMNMKKNIYRIQVFSGVQEILEDLTLYRPAGIAPVPSYKLLRSEKNARGFLQGCFLASGSVNHPKTTNYHLELAFPTQQLAAAAMRLMERFGMEAKMIERKENWLVYLKAGDKIADFLRLLGCTQTLFDFEDTRIQRDLFNQITRLDNCELANEMKTQQAATRQLEWIASIESCPSLHVPEKVRHVMEARKQNPDASTNELCDAVYLLYGEVISKSGMKHRMNKIKELAASREE